MLCLVLAINTKKSENDYLYSCKSYQYHIIQAMQSRTFTNEQFFSDINILVRYEKPNLNYELFINITTNVIYSDLGTVIGQIKSYVIDDNYHNFVKSLSKKILELYT